MTLTDVTLDPTDIESLATAISLGITTPIQLASWLEVELIDDCLVLNEPPIYANDGNAEIEYDHPTTAEEAAKDYVDTGDWGEIDSTTWIHVRTYLKGVNKDGEIVSVDEDLHRITIEPDEPDCIEGESHRWRAPVTIVGGIKENPGVWGHGGGVIMKECCTLCGCGKVADTWAQDRSTGEQGLTSVEYTEGKYTDEINARHIQRAKDRLDTASEQTGEFYLEWRDDDGDIVGADEGNLRDYGIALLLDPDTPKISGTAISTPDDDE